MKEVKNSKMMKIVMMDGYAANPGDIPWQPWKEISAADGSLCEFVEYDRTPAELVVERAKEADILLTNKVIISDEVMAKLPRLRYVGVLATGYNVVDVEAARRHGIVVTNIPAYSTASVAQLVFAHLLNITNSVARHADAVSKGDWGRCPDFSFFLTPQMELSGRNFAIIGLGNIGNAVARMADAMGMKVLAFTSKSQAELPPYINKVSELSDLFRMADVLSLHCPLTAATHHIVNGETLSLMKPTAIVINTSRGPLVDENALADALNEERLLAAGLDVLEVEPPTGGSPLFEARNCFVTPHLAWASMEARKRLLDMAVENVKAFLSGQPRNVVS